MEPGILRDKQIIQAFLEKDKENQIYCIGDLDDFFWPKTTWYSLAEKNNIRSVALLYSGMEIPTLLLFSETDPESGQKLLQHIKDVLPEKFYAHLSPGLVRVFREQSISENHGLHYKMSLRTPPQKVNEPDIRRLDLSHLSDILDLYTVAYRNNWFDKRMLETGKYFGLYDGIKLTGIAGIHVFSRFYRVAALGNIATHPDHRGRHIAFRLTSALCCDLLQDDCIIGLNVKSDNEYAIRCYKKAGFAITGKYEEFLIQK